MASGSGGQCFPWLAARLPLFTPACAPTPHQSSIHSAPTSLPSPASPVPLTPLDAVLSAMPDPGLSGEGIRRHQVHPGPSPASAWVAVPRGNDRPQAGPPAASLLQKSLWSPYCSRRSLRVTSFCGSPRALLLLSRSPALEAPTRPWEARAGAAPGPSTK